MGGNAIYPSIAMCIVIVIYGNINVETQLAE